MPNRKTTPDTKYPLCQKLCRLCRHLCRRFDTAAEFRALQRVYQSLCPMINYFIPNKKLVSKTSVGSKTVKKYDSPKTPYQRLMESDLPGEVKNRLEEQYRLLNPVVLQYNVHKAVAALMRAHKAKVTFSK